MEKAYQFLDFEQFRSRLHRVHSEMIRNNVIVGRLQLVVANVLFRLFNGGHIDGRLVGVVRAFGVEFVPLLAALLSLPLPLFQLLQRPSQTFAGVTSYSCLSASSNVVAASLRLSQSASCKKDDIS